MFPQFFALSRISGFETMARVLKFLLPFTFLLPGWLSSAAVLVDFQVAQPLTLPKDAKQCTALILERTFAFSYGSPEIVQYTPPTDCGPVGSWAGVSLNFTVTSNGTQYDRLGIFTLEQVEIWRTSTPEPTRGDGIIWTYLKDVSRYIPLFANPGTFVLQLDNLIQTGLDGEYATTLYATFYASSAKYPPASHADIIIPISTLANDTGDVASIPPGFSLNVTIPQNAIGVYAEVIPSGNGNEEFWPMNVPNQYLNKIPDGLTFGYGPFREVRLSVDGLLAGSVFPYVVVFTGGIAPTLWRPITAYGALDLPTYYLDLTPFIPMLTDGKSHNISLDVVSAESDHSINQNWYVTANLQVLTNAKSSKRTTGNMIVYDVQPYAHTSTSGTVAKNGDLDFTVKANRDIHIESNIITGDGEKIQVVWSQSLSFTNVQTYSGNATIQTLQQSSSGSVSSTHNGVPSLVDIFSFPFNVDFTYLASDYSNWTTSIDHSYNRVSLVDSILVEATIKERQTAAAFFQLASTGNFGNGTSSTTFSYVDLKGNIYTREVTSLNSTVTSDHQGGTLPPVHQALISTVSKSTFARPRLPGTRIPSN